MAMENNLSNLTTAGQVDMTASTSGTSNVIKTGSSTVQSNRQPSVQLLQRGYIIGSAEGGPVDVSEVVDRLDTDESVAKSQLTALFKNTGNLFYGKKVYAVELGKWYYYSKGNNAGSMGDDSWKAIE